MKKKYPPIFQELVAFVEKKLVELGGVISPDGEKIFIGNKTWFFPKNFDDRIRIDLEIARILGDGYKKMYREFLWEFYTKKFPIAFNILNQIKELRMGVPTYNLFLNRIETRDMIFDITSREGDSKFWFCIGENEGAYLHILRNRQTKEIEERFTQELNIRDILLS